MKSIYASKTFWVQVVTVVSLAVPVVREWLERNPVEFLSVLASLNVLVRFATSGKVTVFGDKTAPSDDDGETGSGGVGTLPLLLMCGTAAALMAALPSCSNTGSLPITWKLYGEDGAVSYSAKRGIEVEVRVEK